MYSLKSSGALLACLVVGACGAPSADEPAVNVLSLQEQAETFFDLNVKRVDRLMLPAMRNAGIDCWILMSREGFIDPVLEYIRDENGEGGHRNAFIFFDDGSERLQRIVIGTHLPGSDTRVFDQILGYPSEYGAEGPSLQPELRRVIHALQPRRIGVNQSRTIGTSDGLTVEMKKHLVDAIGPRYAARIVSAEQVSTDFLGTHIAEEFPLFEEAAKIGQLIHEEVLSNRAIQPGVTTVEEVVWYAYNRMHELGVVSGYPVTLSVNRQGEMVRGANTVIQPGDLLKTDIGIIYTGLYTDFKRTAYVLRPGETTAPAGLQAALDNAVKVQDAVAGVALPGVLGYEVKDQAEAICRRQGVDANVASHSVDGFIHGVGSWFSANWPDRTSVRSTFPVRNGAFYALESSATTEIPEWGNKRLSFGTEESVYATPEGLRSFIPRQEKLYLISSQ
jgi:methionine aminopeptidase